ncbi:MAG: hypothetical protein KDD66_11100 [Bdellovibrionales bacterium]|nr:hypothetical protein [Bdellovibrionales bacterium]
MTQDDVAWKVVGAMLKPLVRFCVRKSFPLQEFVNVAKVAYVEAAEDELSQSGEKVNVSRLSTMTGVHRVDVAKIHKHGQAPQPEGRPLNTLHKVVECWEQDPRFLTTRGKPRILSYRGQNSELKQLVSTVSKHADPGAMLFELKRAGMVEVSKRGVKLLDGMVRVAGGVENGYRILAHDMDRLIAAVEENLSGTRISNVHISTAYENIYVDDLAKVRRWLLEQSKAFHRRIREYLAKHDADATTDPNAARQAGGCVSLCSFSTTSELPEEIDEQYLRKELRGKK